MSDAMREFMQKEIQEEREGAARKAAEDAARKADEQRAVSDIRSLMKKLKLTASQAMDALSIPDAEQVKYVALL